MKQFLTCYLVCLVGLVIFTFFGGLNLLFFFQCVGFYRVLRAGAGFDPSSDHEL